MNILYQDARIFVCLKPSGVVSTDEAGGMPARIRAWLGDAHACVRTVHRLDAAVAGVMVFARSRAAAAILSQQIRARTFEKEYLAVLCGIPAEPSATLRDWLVYDRDARCARVVPAPERDAREAVLDYRVLAEKDGRALVRVRLHTGRTHQIRAQFSSRGLPLLGDRKYGEPSDFPIALWSFRLRFAHPQSGEELDFSAAPPDAAPWNTFSEFFLTQPEVYHEENT